MSDDEYYDDEYADFHDMLYDADPDPDLADDLAEHAAHSPVYIDNPNEEVRDYFSDWEYYSDDYFDDDPILLANMSKDQAGEKSSTRSNQQGTKRGRKRKLSEARDRPHSDTKELKALKACMQGTVWKTQSPELEENYRGGNSQRVALRLSKAIMRSAYSTKKGFGTGRAAKDESWANDLSLADMGLRTETSMDLQHNNSSVVNDEIIEEDDGEEGENEEEDVDMSHELGAEAIKTSNRDGRQQRAEADGLKVSHTDQLLADGISVEDSEIEEARQTKRRKMNISESSAESKTCVITPETSLDPDASDTAMDIEPQNEANPPKSRGGRPKRQTSASSRKSTAKAATNGGLNTGSQREISKHAGSTSTASTASSRAKRNPSSGSATTSAKTSKASTAKITKTTRKTRSQQK